jgi:sedoheptulokinase
MYVTGIDIGTASIACVAVDIASGEVLKSVIKENQSAFPGEADEALQDPEAIIEAVYECVKEVSPRSQVCAGIGVSGQMHGIVYTGRDGLHKGPLIGWQDRRGERKDHQGRQYVAHINERSGHVVHTGYGLVSHYVNCRLNQVPSDAVSLCTIGDYAAMRLTGVKTPVMNATQAASIGCFDVSKLRFDEDVLQRPGIETGILPQLVPSSRAVGHTSSNVPVFSCIGDNQASFIGSVTSLKHSLLINVGTGAQVSAYSSRYVNINGLDTRPFPNGGYLLVGASLSGGKSYALLEQFFREVCRLFSDSFREEALYDLMNQMAQTQLSGHPLTVHTQFYGSRGEGRQVGSIEGITNINWTPAHLIQGFLSGMTEELAHFFKLLPEELRSGLKEWNMAGNGVRLNPALQNLVEDKLGIPLRKTTRLEEAAYGAAMHAAVSSGIFHGYEDVLRSWRQ